MTLRMFILRPKLLKEPFNRTIIIIIIIIITITIIILNLGLDIGGRIL